MLIAFLAKAAPLPQPSLRIILSFRSLADSLARGCSTSSSTRASGSVSAGVNLGSMSDHVLQSTEAAMCVQVSEASSRAARLRRTARKESVVL